MRQRKRASLGLLHCAVCLSFAVAVVSAHAQSPANWNAVVQSSSGTVQTSASYAVVDATQYTGDICAKIAAVFNEYLATGTTPTNGVVVDARGVTTQLTCSGNPWAPLWTTTNTSNLFTNTVLLPAATISISAAWVLPNRTHLIGQGPNSTVIQASGTSNFDMIDMGKETSGPCGPAGGPFDCPNIEIEHLTLNGNGKGMGIVNCCAQELSRVNDVSMTNVTTGLALTDEFSENSGPYSNLTISAVNSCVAIGPASGSTNVMINSRGVHGLTCVVGSSSSSKGAIMLDGPDNELEDITVSSATSGMDGILIGSKGPAEGNTLTNIVGASGLTNVIHISNATSAKQANGNGYCPFPSSPGAVNNVCDLTILGIAGQSGTNTLRDDLTNTTVTDLSLGMYSLGEYVGTNSASIGNSRLTTAAANTNTTPWLVGPAAPISACAVGALYSCTGSSSSCTNSSNVTATLWQCVGSSTGSTWAKIQ